MLLANILRHADGQRIVPIYVRTFGLAWNARTCRYLEHVLSEAAFRGVQPLETLHFDMRDVYPPSHWAIKGEAPGFDTPDEDVYLEGRNVVLLTKAAVFMARAGLLRVSIGPLAGNPFPMSPRSSLRRCRTRCLGLATAIEIAAPLLSHSKADVIALGQSLGVPLELTLSCMQPSSGLHCGRCSKCRERKDAFREAGVEDRTIYQPESRSAL